MRDALESRYRMRIDGHNPIIPWIVTHAAATISRFRVGDGGKTPIERIRGRKCIRAQIEFGECVMFLHPGTEGNDKADYRWGEGVYIGIRNRSEEYLIGTKEGVTKVRTVKRRATKEEQWNQDMFKSIRGTPWEPIPGREGVELRSRIVVVDIGQDFPDFS